MRPKLCSERVLVNISVNKIDPSLRPEHQSLGDDIKQGVGLTLQVNVLPRIFVDLSYGCMHGGQIGQAGRRQCRVMRSMTSSPTSPRMMMSTGRQLSRPPGSPAQRLEQPDLAGRVLPCHVIQSNPEISRQVYRCACL